MLPFFDILNRVYDFVSFFEQIQCLYEKDFDFGEAKINVFFRVFDFESFSILIRLSDFYIFTLNFNLFIAASLLKTKIPFL